MIAVAELKGYKSYLALLSYHKLMLGLKMLPAYATRSYEDFYAALAAMAPEDQEKLVREAALFVDLTQDELGALLVFAKDANGVPYTSENLRSLGPDEIHEIVVAVCLEIGKIKITLVSEAEKKK